MMMDNINQFEVAVHFRVQANPPAYLLSDLDDSMNEVLSLINQQVETKVNAIIEHIGDESSGNDDASPVIQADSATSLLNLCHDDLPSSYTFCANLESTIHLNMDLSGEGGTGGFLHYELVKELRQLVATSDYPDSFDAHVTWLGPYWTTAELGWRVLGGQERTMADSLMLQQERAGSWFGNMISAFIGRQDNTSMSADGVAISSLQRLEHGDNDEEGSSVEILGTIYGTCDCTPLQYQEQLVELFNNGNPSDQTSSTSFLNFLRDNKEDGFLVDSFHRIQTFALDDDRDLDPQEKRNDVSSTTRSRGVNLKFMNTYHVAGGLFSLFVTLQLIGCCWVVLAKKRQRAMKDGKCSSFCDDDEDGECSFNSPETSVATFNIDSDIEKAVTETCH